MGEFTQFQDTARFIDKYCFYYPHRALNYAEMAHNAAILFTVLMNSYNNFSRSAVAAMVGNMEAESTINPGRWQNDTPGFGGGGGLGLVQWTPWTNYTNWADDTGIYGWYDGYGQMDWLNTQTVPAGQWIATGMFPFSWGDFKGAIEADAGEKAMWFVKNFERPANQSQAVLNYRASLARKWYDTSIENGWAGLDDIPTKPIEPPVPPVKRKGMPVWMMLRRPF